MAGISRLSPGCICCQGGPEDPPPSPCCIDCNDGFPGSLWTGEYDVTFSGFTDSSECDKCDFLNGTFTLQCIFSNTLCVAASQDLPTNYVPGETCYYGVSFEDYIGDRFCSSSEAVEGTALTIYKSFGWTGLVLARYKIDNGGVYGTEWRLHMGYKMEISLTETVLDAEGNPVIRGSFNSTCDDYFYHHIMYNVWPSPCALDDGDTFTKSENVGEITVDYDGETASTSFSDWCSASGSVTVEAVLV